MLKVAFYKFTWQIFQPHINVSEELRLAQAAEPAAVKNTSVYKVESWGRGDPELNMMEEALCMSKLQLREQDKGTINKVEEEASL